MPGENFAGDELFPGIFFADGILNAFDGLPKLTLGCTEEDPGFPVLAEAMEPAGVPNPAGTPASNNGLEDNFFFDATPALH